MAAPKKGAIHQLFVPMVDSTDFVSIKSTVTASQFNAGTRKFYGMNTGTSAAMTSGAISKLASLVRSGVFRVTLKTTENNFDVMQARFAGVTGCAEQIMQWSCVDNDDSDIMSALTVIQSMASDAASAAIQANSRVLLNQSRISDAYSMLSDFLSDFQSRVPKRVATDSQLSDVSSDLRSLLGAGTALTVSAMSDVASQVWAHAVGTRVDSRILVAQSFLSDIRSSTSDLLSDLLSLMTVTGVQLNASTMSDLRSAVAAGPAGVLTVSDISDIASRVQAVLASDISDILSGVRQTASRALVIQSQASDTYSMLSDMQSDFQSRVPKLVANNSQLSDLASDLKSAIAGVTAAVSASDMSDISSRVVAALASDISDILSGVRQTASRALVIQSQASDTYSMVSDLLSDFQSRVPKRVATDSQLSDLASDLKSAMGAITASVSASDMSDISSRVVAALASDVSDMLSGIRQNASRLLVIQSTASDAASAAQQGNSRVLVVQSQASDLASKLSDVESNLLSFLATTGVQLNTSVMSDIRSAVQAVTVNLTQSDISDIASAVAAAVTTITTSDISDIASRVDQVLASRLSDILSAAQQANSRVLVIQSQASDTYSLLSDLNSNFNSRVPLEPAGRSQLVLVASMASDAASAAQQTNSRVLLNQSRISDVYSLLSDLQSDFQSRVPKRVATDSQLSAMTSDVLSALAAGVPVSASDMSDIRSAIAAGTLTQSAISDIASAVALEIASNLSDILSGVRQTASRALVVQSGVSDIYSLLSDVSSDLGVMSGVQSDLYSAVQAGVEVGASSMSDIRSVVAAHGVLRTGTEPTGVVGHGDTLAAKVDWMAALTRNRVEQTATLQRLKNDANNDTIASAVTSDDGTTFVRDEFA